MAKYDPKRVLRQVSNHLLKELFKHYEIELEVPWDELKQTQVQSIFDAWQDLEEESRRTIDLTLQDINEMATDDGIRAVIEEAKASGNETLIDTLGRYESRYDRAVHTLMNDRDVWQRAVQFARADSVSRGRYWIKRLDLPTCEPSTTEANLLAFETRLSEFFVAKEARGKFCKVEHYVRANGVDYFFAYLDNYAGTIINFDDRGEFARTPERLAFELVFAYDSSDGTLELFAQGGKKVYVALQEMFAETLLGEPIGEGSVESRPSLSFDVSYPNSCNLKSKPVGMRELGEKYLKTWGLDRGAATSVDQSVTQ